jgi:hypothetical protein
MRTRLKEKLPPAAAPRSNQLDRACEQCSSQPFSQQPSRRRRVLPRRLRAATAPPRASRTGARPRLGHGAPGPARPGRRLGPPEVVQVQCVRSLGSASSTTRGHVVTNAHVVDGARNCTVTLASGDEHPDRTVGSGSGNDLAVVHLSGVTPEPPVFADSFNLQVGPRSTSSSATPRAFSELAQTACRGQTRGPNSGPNPRHLRYFGDSSVPARRQQRACGAAPLWAASRQGLRAPGSDPGGRGEDADRAE